MGKSAKAKKEKKADFTKVKLKVGKKLPKGQNLTDTAFKSRKIVVGEQLKKHCEDEPLTRKNLSLKELLSHLRHYSAYVRQDGLNGLRELLASHPEMLLPSLQQVLTAIAALLADEDYKLRTQAVAQLTHIINEVSRQQAEPFLPALVAHVSCALTHLQAGVRRSSLPLLTALLARFPGPLAGHADTLLPCLLRQLTGSDSGAALRADPSSQLASATYRAAVLRLMAQVMRCQTDSGAASAAASVHRGAARHCGLPRPPPTGDALTLTTEKEQRMLQHPERLQQLAGQLLPLLLQTYAEVAPESRSDGSVLGDETAETLCAVLEVLVALLGHMRQLDASKDTHLVDWFAECHGTEVNFRLLASFPYSRSIGKRRPQQGAGTDDEPLGSDAVNLHVCELATALGGAAGQRARRRAMDYLTEYLLSDRCGHLWRVCDLLLRLLSEPASASVDAAPEVQLVQRRCLAAAAERHRGGSPAQAAPLVRLMAAVVSGPTLSQLARCEEVQSWAVRMLPGLRPDCDASLLPLLRRMASIGHPEFVSELNKHAAQLLDSAAAAGADATAIHWQRSVIELLFWPLDVTPQTQRAYERFLGAEGVDESVKLYAREVLDDKYVTKVVDVTG